MGLSRRAFAIVVLAAGVAAAHIQFKPELDQSRIKDMASTLARQAGWMGKVAPDFELQLRGEERVRLSEQVGKKVVVLNFFATWCAPCKKEMPEFERFWNATSKGEFLLVGIDAGEDAKVVDAFVSQLELHFPIGIDQHNTISNRYGVKGLPTTVVIGVDGRVALYETGAIANADVTFGGILEHQRQMLAAGKGITREAYLAAAAAEDYTSITEADKPATALTGRAAKIAEVMNCTCGCDNKLGECNCKTAKEIKKKLAAEMARGGYEKMTDAEVIAALDKEFCIPGKQNDQHH